MDENLIEKSKKLFTLVETPSGDVFEMSAFEHSRWLALIEAVEVVERGAAQFKINLDTSSDWIQPIAFEKYVRERYADILHDQMRNTDFTNTLKCTSSSVTPSELPVQP